MNEYSLAKVQYNNYYLSNYYSVSYIHLVCSKTHLAAICLLLDLICHIKQKNAVSGLFCGIKKGGWITFHPPAAKCVRTAKNLSYLFSRTRA